MSVSRRSELGRESRGLPLLGVRHLDFGTQCRYALVTALSAITRGGADMADEELTTDELLVEEVSIDGMCGVY